MGLPELLILPMFIVVCVMLGSFVIGIMAGFGSDADWTAWLLIVMVATIVGLFIIGSSMLMTRDVQQEPAAAQEDSDGTA